MWWIGAVGYGVWLWSAYDKHKILAVFRRLKADGNMLTVTAATTTTEEKEPGEKVFAGDASKRQQVFFWRLSPYMEVFTWSEAQFPIRGSCHGI